MPSREVRRVLNKKDKEPEEKQQQEDTRFKGRPVLYALSVVTLVIIVITFIGAPVVSRWAYGERFVFGSYEGQEIAFIPGYDNYFNNQYQYWAEQFSRYNFAGGDVKQQIEYAFRYAFENTIQHIAVMKQAEKSGVHVSQSAIEDSLLEFGPYVVGGTFNKEVYDRTPKSNRNAIASRRYEELLEQKYIEDIVYGSLNKDYTKESEFIANMINKERQFSIVNFDFDKYPNEQIKQYATGNKEKFNKLKLSRIVIKSSKKEAESIREMAVTGERSFEDLARSFSKDELYAESGGDMGFQHNYDLKLLLETDENVKKVFGVTKGNYTEVLELKNELGGEKSWLFFKVDSDLVEPDLENVETINLVKTYILSNEKSVMDTYFMDKAKEFKKLADAKGFAEASRQLGLNVPKDTEFFPINYNNVFESKTIKLIGGDETVNIGSVATNEDVLTTLFSLKENQISEPFLLNNQILVAKMLSEREMPAADKKAIDDKLKEWRQQTTQKDMTEQLIDEKKKRDNFADAFSRFFGWRFQS